MLYVLITEKPLRGVFNKELSLIYDQTVTVYVIIFNYQIKKPKPCITL